MAKITEENYVSLEDLMQLLNSSESTIRRDLGELEQEGRLHRVHGGAELFTLYKRNFLTKKSLSKTVILKKLLRKEPLSLSMTTM